MARSLPKGFAQLSGKHALVDKANTTVIIAAAAAAAIVVFSLFASKALIDKINYQNKVINKRQAASKQLEENIAAKNQLLAAYLAFDGSPESIMGTADKNSKIVLDALPSKYDFPALTTSLDSIVSGAGMTVESITGTDEEVSALQSSINPTTIIIPFELAATGDYEATQRLINDLQRSIRPFKILAIDFEADDTGVISVSITGEAYYQPAKELGITELKVDKKGNFVEEGAAAASGTPTTTGGTTQ